MADYDLTLSRDAIPALLDQPAALGKLVEVILNQVLEAQMRDHLGAERYERCQEREGYRNGYRDRQLSTRVGSLVLRVPQTRDGSFSTDIFERYRRSEQAFVVGLMEMVVNGVSTRKVTRITEGLCGTSFSKSTVSRLTKALNEPVAGFLNRRLDAAYPFIIVDALFTKVRTDKSVVSKALLIASGIRADGYREILGLSIGDSESFATWNEFFRGLKARGLHGVDVAVSDNHSGLREAIAKQFVGATWQRCQFHVMKNLLDHAPKKERENVTAAARLIFLATDRKEAERRYAEFMARFAETAPKSCVCLEGAFEDMFAILPLPEKYRRRLRTSNMQERLNEEIRRREKVIRIFPNDAAAIRMVGALLSEQNDEWLSRAYFDMTEYFEWKATTVAKPAAVKRDRRAA
ncbi:IS256 family transposase [Vulcanimicrobium alpinum]|uniref:Mutator family transposase n=1 Tax=Vulcanimicrobium alpinum TaxID=3016050 RepID=A0AAN2CAD4_UNVUL|nr:IS256 family transposase [Vulcanimicrobium alpinum]BDE06552.1 IS256 family transposase [Vulcanimicrobium alpinum]BDE06857.1 IS256 family transposase [Vulcanimicrobium alpinum]